MVLVSEYYVYIMSSHTKTFYVGVTSDLERRAFEHRYRIVPGFTSKYNVRRLVYFESTSDVRVALQREKQIKGWRRERKIALIESANPGWDDLSEAWQQSKAETLRFAQGDIYGIGGWPR